MPIAAVNVVVLAAGRGVRMRASRAKLLHEACGRPLIEWALEAARAVEPRRIVAVVPDTSSDLARTLEPAGVECCVQPEPRGTGDAVARALAVLDDERTPVLVMNGDLPCLRGETLRRLVAAHGAASNAATMLTGRRSDPTGWGRVRRTPAGAFDAVVEERDATPAERALTEVNVGPVVVDPGLLAPALGEVLPAPGSGEIYFPAALSGMRARGGRVDAVDLAAADEVQQVNTQEELAACAAVLRRRLLAALNAQGVVVTDPDSTYVEWGAEVGPGTVLLPFTVIRRGVRVGAHCEVGPFAHLRAGTVLRDRAEIGNFVEVKASEVGVGAKAKHLTYLGDATVGAGANVGAGTITANYDGRAKHRTEIGDRAFIGSGTILVAPVRVGAGAVTGAGAVVTRGHDVAPGETVVGVPARPLGRRDRPGVAGGAA